jgi:AcrR family transcriptional regulator
MASEIDRAATGSTRRRRADAERSVTAILAAAVRVLGERPEASMEDVAAAAGVTRQTVYAHFASRKSLLEAVVDHFSRLTSQRLLGPDLDDLPPVDALRHFLDASWGLLEDYPVLLHLGGEPMAPEADHDLHRPILDRLERLVRRGQRNGDFDRKLPAGWLAIATIALGHAAGEEVRAGRMRAKPAGRAYRRSVLGLYGVRSGGSQESDQPTG